MKKTWLCIIFLVLASIGVSYMSWQAWDRMFSLATAVVADMKGELVGTPPLLENARQIEAGILKEIESSSKFLPPDALRSYEGFLRKQAARRMSEKYGILIEDATGILNRNRSRPEQATGKGNNENRLRFNW